MFFFQAEDGIRDLVRSRGLGDVYKRQGTNRIIEQRRHTRRQRGNIGIGGAQRRPIGTQLGLSLIHI